MIKYDDYLKGASPDLSDMSKDALYERGKFLVEVVDKNAPLSGSRLQSVLKDNFNMENRRLVIPYSPSAGKTTAVRQLVSDSALPGLYSSKLIDDLELLYYDIHAQARYLNKGEPSVIRFYDKHVPDATQLLGATWVLCTHARLLIEPSSVLTVYSQNMYLPTMNRYYCLIDEYPTNVYKYAEAKDVTPLLLIDNEAMKSKDLGSTVEMLGTLPQYVPQSSYEELAKSIIRKSYVDQEIKRSVPNDTSYAIDYVSTPGILPSNSFSDIRKLPVESKEFQFKAARISFFIDHYVKEFERNRDKGGSISTKLYYSLYNLADSINVAILDGTSDLILGKVDSWKTVRDDELTTRSMNINKFSLLETYSDRSHEESSIIDEYFGIITNIRKDHPGEHILVYMWKFSKYNNNELGDDSVSDDVSKSMKDKLLARLTEYGDSEVSIITYMSGEEKGTNKYSTASVAVILGEFFIPRYVINDMSIALGDKDVTLTSEDYTEALLIQFLYRTRARKRNLKDNSISIYMDHRYENLARKLFKDINISGVTEDDVVPVVSDTLKDSRIIKLREYVQGGYMTKLENSQGDDQELYATTSSKLAELLGIKSLEKRRLMNKVSELDLPSPLVVPRVGVPGDENSKYTVYIFSHTYNLDNTSLPDIGMNKSWLGMRVVDLL